MVVEAAYDLCGRHELLKCCDNLGVDTVTGELKRVGKNC